MLGPSLLTRSGTVCEALAATTFVKFNLLDEKLTITNVFDN